MNILILIICSFVGALLIVNPIVEPKSIQDYCKKHFEKETLENCLTSKQSWYDDARRIETMIGISGIILVWVLFIIDNSTNKQQVIRKDALGIIDRRTES